MSSEFCLKLANINGNISDFYPADANLANESVNDLKSAVSADAFCKSASVDLVDFETLCRDVGDHRNSRACIEDKIQWFVAAVNSDFYHRPVADKSKRNGSLVSTIWLYKVMSFDRGNLEIRRVPLSLAADPNPIPVR